MKLEIVKLPEKPRKMAQVGDVIIYTHPSGLKTINGIIVKKGNGTYRLLNIDTMTLGDLERDTPDELMLAFSQRKDFKHYPKDSWQTKLVLEELK